MKIMMDNFTAATNGSGQADELSEQEQLTDFEHYFYLLNGLAGTGLNLAVLLINFLHVDFEDKPRQVG
jgi:hypothetical protein